jgi:hypothetical protein
VPQPVYCGAFSHWLLALHCLHVPHSLHWRVTPHSSTNEPQTIPLEAQVWVDVQPPGPPVVVVVAGGVIVVVTGGEGVVVVAAGGVVVVVGHAPQSRSTPQTSVNEPHANPRDVQVSSDTHWHVPPLALVQTLGGEHNPQGSGRLQSLVNVPQVKPEEAHVVSGVQPHCPATPPPPHDSGSVHEPQSHEVSQSSVKGPHARPAVAQDVVGVQPHS